MKYGFIKVATAVPRVKVADCVANVAEIKNLVMEADEKGVEVVLFPELALTGATCGDLFAQPLLHDAAHEALMQLLCDTRHCNVIAVVGMPLSAGNSLLNAAVVIYQGSVLGVVPKTILSVEEQRWFTSATDFDYDTMTLCNQEVSVYNNLLFDFEGASFAVTFSTDLHTPYAIAKISALREAEIVLTLAADNEVLGKWDYLSKQLAQQSAAMLSANLYCSCGFGESTTDTVYAGNALILEKGKMLAQSERFCMESQLVVSEVDVDLLSTLRRKQPVLADRRTTLFNSEAECIEIPYQAQPDAPLTRTFNPHPFVPQGAKLDERCREIFAIQTTGLAQRLLHTNTKTAVIGISGGLDSTLALLVCVKAFDKLGWDRKNILGVTMPGFGTTDRTYTNALSLMQSLGITQREISIKKACLQHFEDIGHDVANHDVVYENSQARERTQILMDIANQTWGMVVGTGDLSELALGWATYNGDHMSMYSVNGGVPKTLVKHLVKWVAENDVEGEAQATLLDIVDTPISPELTPADEQGNIKQKTEDLVGPYELHDFFLYHFMHNAFRPAKIYYLACHTFEGKYDEETIKKWLKNFFRRFFNQQFKRSCLPDGPKVGSISISPRGDWRMPSDASSTLWQAEVDKL